MIKKKLPIAVLVISAFFLGYLSNGQYSYFKFSNQVYSTELLNFNMWAALKLLQLHDKDEAIIELSDYAYNASLKAVSTIENEHLSRKNNDLLEELKERINMINAFEK